MKYKEKTNDYWVLARLTDDIEYHSTPPSHMIVYFFNGKTVFQARRISNLPKEYPDTTFYATDTECLRGLNHTFMSTQDEVSAQREIENVLGDKVLLFLPFRGREGNDNMDWKTGVRVLPAPTGFSKESRYRVLPLLSSHDHDMTEEELRTSLLNPATFLHIERKLSPSPEDMPPFILWKRPSEEIVIYGPITDMRHTPAGGYNYTASSLKCIPLPDGVLQKSVPTPVGVIFLPEDEMDTLSEALQDAPVISLLTPAGEDAPKEEIPAVQACADTTDTAAGKAEQPPAGEKGSHDEAAFLSRFASHVRASGYVYSEEDLINFHVAMKSSTLVILSGMSGTGKSKIVSLYGESLGLTEKELRMIPVRPSWTDDTDILGYLDTTTMLYRAADTGLVDTLRDASRNPDRLYLICFDEMNLARVEHYFSQFLSVLENPCGKRFLQLYNPELECRVYNATEYPARIELSDNLLFVGTVNLDESTFHFSDKVLDRANVIRFHRCSFAEFKACSLETPEEKALLPSPPVPASQYLSFRNPEKRALSLSDEEISFLSELDTRLDASRADGGIGFRILRQIDDYLKNVPEGTALTHGEAFDLQIAQRILTKVRGSREQLQDLLEASRKDNGKYLPDLLDQYRDLSDFAECRSILAHKGGELIEYGYIL